MNLLLCGLNSYLGRAGLAYLPDDKHSVFGIARDVGLLKEKMGAGINATLYSVDLIKKGVAYDSFNIEGLNLSIYFAQIPNQKDQLGVQYELLSLRNFIFLSRQNGCDRIVYVGRAHDKGYLKAVEALFVELGVVYTILLKDLAIGLGSSFDLFMDELLKTKNIFLYAGLVNKKFKPIILADLFSFIKSVNWQESFINQCLEFGGEQLMSVNELVKWSIKIRGQQDKHQVFSIPSKLLTIWINKLLHGVDRDIYDDYLLGIMGGGESHNSLWQGQVDFKTSPILLDI